MRDDGTRKGTASKGFTLGEQQLAAVRDAQRAVAATGIALAGFSGIGEPIFRHDLIVFNGVRGGAVEPFEIHQTEFDRRGRSTTTGCCKTGGAPYDACVRITLIVLKHHLGGGIHIHSDEREGNRAAARMFCERTLGYGENFKLRDG